MPKVFITETHTTQRTNCRARNMPQPTYTRDELQTWLVTKSNHLKYIITKILV
jgi:hypothetical protein